MKKKLAALIIAGLGKPSKSEATDSEETESSDDEEVNHKDGMKAAVESLFAAMKEEDVESGVDALIDFLDIYESQEHEE